ncbi:sigma-54 dependent transcriptional regulator [Alphaproteobacteria bacterium]|nr:sigma-54 dependent transcriptional regulator [Alphaproteobacteria bacterium]
MALSVDEIIIGQSAPVKDLRRLIEVVAVAKTNVLVLGETGSGKELVARALHAQSGRKGKLVSVNCAAIPSELLESELFGHEKGAFTGADKVRAGRFEMAKGGTLFLDEIGDMPLSLQAKLLRALENKVVQRVGGGEDVPVDFRLVCATHQKIEQKVDDGSFRSDLYFRINVFPVNVPTLAERKVDIPLIADVILNKMADEEMMAKPKLDESAWAELSRYTWPGNVRELRNVMERATVLFAGQTITGTHVRENLLRLKVPNRKEEQEALWAASQDLMGIDFGGETSGGTPGEAPSEAPLPHPAHYADWFSYFDSIDLRRHLRDVEAVLIEAALEKSDGMVSQAANALKLQRTTLIEKMKKLLIERPNPTKSDTAKSDVEDGPTP